jgi:hypothetical protein
MTIANAAIANLHCIAQPSFNFERQERVIVAEYDRPV